MITILAFCSKHPEITEYQVIDWVRKGYVKTVKKGKYRFVDEQSCLNQYVKTQKDKLLEELALKIYIVLIPYIKTKISDLAVETIEIKIKKAIDTFCNTNNLVLQYKGDITAIQMSG